MVAMAPIAAMPEAKANAPRPPSIAAMLSSRASARRVLRARVLVALVAAELFLHVGRGLEDRRDDGAGGRIRLLARMDTHGREAGVCREFHQGHLSVRGAGSRGNCDGASRALR